MARILFIVFLLFPFHVAHASNVDISVSSDATYMQPGQTYTYTVDIFAPENTEISIVFQDMHGYLTAIRYTNITGSCNLSTHHTYVCNLETHIDASIQFIMLAGTVYSACGTDVEPIISPKVINKTRLSNCHTTYIPMVN